MKLKQNLLNLSIIFEKLNNLCLKKIIKKKELKKNLEELVIFAESNEDIILSLNAINNLKMGVDNFFEKLLILEVNFRDCSIRANFSLNLLKKIILNNNKMTKMKVSKKNIVLFYNDKNDLDIRLLDTYKLLVKLNDFRGGKLLEVEDLDKLYKYVARYKFCQEKIAFYLIKLNELEVVDMDKLIDYLVNLNLYLTDSIVIIKFFDDCIRVVFEKY